MNKEALVQTIFENLPQGSRIFVQGGAATPHILLDLLVANTQHLQNAELVSISLQGKLPFSTQALQERFFMNSLFVSENTRKQVNSPFGSYTPIFLSEIPRLFKSGQLPLQLALIHVSPPDKHGFCSLGVSVDVAKAAMQSAQKVIAYVNTSMPRTLGDGLIHQSVFNATVYGNTPLPQISFEPENQHIANAIGKHVAALIEDGATLQMGIGAIPDAVLSQLGSHKHLGVHTEMFSDGVVPLVKQGVIDNSKKRHHPGKLVTGFVLGKQPVYDFVNDNQQVAVLDISYVNDPTVIRKNPKVVAINSAIEIDLSGQVCADTLGTYQYSGFGGQVDFMRGAALSDGGMPIIAMPSVTGKGISKIVPFLKSGAGVVTTRAHVHWVVTEYGAVNLFGLNLHQRAKALISIAHPDHREALLKAAYERHGFL